MPLIRESYFPTLVYYADLAEAASINASVRPHIYAWRARYPSGMARSNAKELGAWHSATDMADRPEFRALADMVLASVAMIFADLGYDPAFAPRIEGMWANINPRNAYNRGHVHPGTLWSGVYYVQAPEGCGRIVFRDPRTAAQMLLPVFAEAALRHELWSEVSFAAMEGRIILFPSWLQHEVEPNLSELEPPAGDRISVSFNILQARIT